jgi:hypothetical protein
VGQFDKNNDKRLDAVERKAAREFLSRETADGSRRGPRPMGANDMPEPATAGPRVDPADVQSAGSAPLYASNIVRTFFLKFENSDWEKELADFHGTDVEVPATLTVDGRSYPDVGIHFRGASSYMRVGEGHKRSLNLSLNFAHPEQRLAGYRTVELLNSHDDPTFLRTVLACQIAGNYMPAPKANFVRVVINGESWGLYVNAQQFNKDFVQEWFHTTKGARWKVPGSPRGQGSLAYLGDDPAPYKRIYQLKSGEDPKAWTSLIRLCKVLNATPTNQLEQALAPLLDIEGTLKFLAFENVLINNDGYWVRTSDYDLYQDVAGRFHPVPHDLNETFMAPSGPGFGGPSRDRRPGGPGGVDNRPPRPGGRDAAGAEFKPAPKVDGVKLDPLVAAADPDKPLISRLLAVPALRTRYLGYVREIADRWLDWKKLGPVATHYEALIEDLVKADTRKLSSFRDFQAGIREKNPAAGEAARVHPMSLQKFAEQRRAYLLEWGKASAH